MAESYQYSDIAIGITTFNRARFVEACAASLNRAKGISQAKILVIDDRSTEYDVDFLENCFHHTAQIERNEINSGGADYACRNILEKLCGSGASILILLDSDLIVSRDFLDQTLQLFERTDGFLSLFNSPTHPEVEARGPLVLKPHVGAAGTVWKREIAEAILSTTPPGLGFDWRFCERLSEAEIEIFAAKSSLVQHLGFAQGQNSSSANGDIGIGFIEADAYNAYAMQQEIAYALNEGYREINQRLDQQQTVIESNLKALQATYRSLVELHERLSLIENKIDHLERGSFRTPSTGDYDER